MPDFSKMIKQISGMESDLYANDSLESLNRVATVNKWSDAFKIEMVRANMEDPVKCWFNSTIFLNLKELTTQFENIFCLKYDTSSRW